MPDTIKALSIIQPWTWLLAKGLKEYETRSWGTYYRGPIALHASKQSAYSREACEELIFGYHDIFNSYGIEDGNDLAYGAVIGTATLVACIPTVNLHDLSYTERAFGNFERGRFAWQMKDATLLPEPIPYRGAQGLWEFPRDLLNVRVAL